MAIVAHKISNVSHEIVVSNLGDEPLEWDLSTMGLLSVSPSAGSLGPQELVILTADVASARMQARAAPYEGNVTIAAVRGVCKCKPQEITIAVSITVTADAHAANSAFSMGNADSVNAGTGTLGFGVSPAE